MNYMYTLPGLPTIGGQEGDRYYLNQLWWSTDRAFARRCVEVTGINQEVELERGPLGPYGDFLIDYSDGSRRVLDERAIDERLGLGNVNSSAVDYDCSGTIDASIALDVNGRLVSDGVGTTELTDHDDWGNLVLVFTRGWDGASLAPTTDVPVSPLTNDRQPAVTEDAPPRALMPRARRR
jgi:hypothetical protein